MNILSRRFWTRWFVNFVAYSSSAGAVALPFSRGSLIGRRRMFNMIAAAKAQVNAVRRETSYAAVTAIHQHTQQHLGSLTLILMHCV